MNRYRHASLLYLISGLILVAGLSTAVLIYRAAENQPAGVSSSAEGEEFIDPLNPENSKQYLRELERYGGQANVLAYQMRLWCVGLWHGKSLAYIIACTAVLASLGVFYAAEHVSPRAPD